MDEIDSTLDESTDQFEGRYRTQIRGPRREDIPCGCRGTRSMRERSERTITLFSGSRPCIRGVVWSWVLRICGDKE